MFYTNNIYVSETLGIWGKTPENFSFENIVQNLTDLISTLDSSSMVSAIDNYLYNGAPFTTYSVDYALDYYYLTKNIFNESVVRDLTALNNAMLERREREYRTGQDAMTGIPTWGTLMPYIHFETTQLRKCVEEILYNNSLSIIYINTTPHQSLIDVYETACDNKFNKITDTIWHINCKNSSTTNLLLMHGEFNYVDFLKVIYNILLGGKFKDKFDERLGTVTGIYTSTIDAKDAMMSKFMSNILQSSALQELKDLDEDIVAQLSRYNKSLSRRATLVRNLEEKSSLIKDVPNLINVLDKCSDSISWKTVGVNNETLVFSITTPLFNYDEGVVKRMFDNKVFESYYSLDKPDRQWIYKLFHDCFLTNTRQLMTRTDVQLTRDLQFLISSGYNMFRSSDTMTYQIGRLQHLNVKYVPNPHIARFNCWGQNGPVLCKLVRERKWEEMVYCLKATLGNLNFNDNTVLNWFIHLLIGIPDTFELCKDNTTGAMLTKGDLRKEIAEDETNKNN